MPMPVLWDYRFHKRWQKERRYPRGRGPKGSDDEQPKQLTIRSSYFEQACPEWYTFTAMPQFVIEREIPGAGSLSDEQLREISLRSLDTLEKMGPQIQWLHSYVTEDKVYCVYLAPDENSVREHARRTGIPADRVSAVRRLLDPINMK
jgi:hypothetical protein